MVEYTYDDLGRVTKEEYFENESETASRTVTYEYNETGNLSKMTDSKTGMTTTYSYDPLGRLVSSYETDGTTKNSSSYSYYATGDLKAESHFIKDTLYNTYYAYDSLRRVVAVKNGNLATGYTYDEFSRLTEKTTFAGQALAIETEITYPTAASGATSNQVLYYEMGTNNTNVQFGYTYDGNGNIIREIRNTNRAGSNSDGIINDRGFVTAYQYDRQNRLTRENNELANKTWVWTYDNAGNITSKKEYAYSTMNFEGDPVVTQYTYGNSNWGDLLTSYNGRTITYDAIGNPLNDGIWNYTWEQGRQLTKMQSSSATWTYSYGTDGLRTSRSNGTTTYRYWYNSSGLLLRMEKGSTVYSFFYDASGRPVCFTEGNAVYFYILNQQGDVVGIVDAGGLLVVSYVYDAWGQPVKTLGSEALGLGARNPLRYRGYVYDTETGLYYLQSRYYNPEWGRFINADDITYLGADGTPLSYNLFAYCKNNPVNFADTHGTFINMITGAIFGGFWGGINALISGDDIWAGISIGAGTGAMAGLCADFAIATGGLGGLALAAMGGAVSNGINYLATEVVNGREIDGGRLVLEMTIGAATNMLTFGVGNGSLTPRSGNKLSNMAKDFTDTIMKGTTKTVAGKVVSRSKPIVRKIKVCNFLSETATSGVISFGSWFNTNAWGTLLS